MINTMLSNISNISKIALATSFFSMVACGGGATSSDAASNNENNEVVVPTSYIYENADNESTVFYSGQTFRQVLINDLVKLGVKTAQYGDSNIADTLADYFDFDDALSGTNAHGFTLSSVNTVASGFSVLPGITYADISSGKDLSGKIAGNDKVAHLQFATIIGYPGDLTTGEAVYDDLVTKFAANLAEQQTVTTAGGEENLSPIVAANGWDFSQIIEKYLRGAISFNQGTADYLLTDWGASGNNDVIEGKTYTTNEHKWDEAFGYFGAARSYNDFTDDEIAGKVSTSEKNLYWDENSDSAIDIASEYNMGHAVNCGKRDRGSDQATDFSKDTFDAFLEGRAILASWSGQGDATAADVAELEPFAEAAAQGWEKCISATAVHYINEVVSDYGSIDSALNLFVNVDDFEAFAKHWSELFGFALSLQFSPYSPFQASANSGEYVKMMNLIGTEPVLPDGTTEKAAAIAEYESDLLEARKILQDVYGFDATVVENW